MGGRARPESPAHVEVISFWAYFKTGGPPSSLCADGGRPRSSAGTARIIGVLSVVGSHPRQPTSVAVISAASSKESFKVLIVGGGVAALEAALALRDFGGERIGTTMLAPNPEFIYRPMTVQEPFGYAAAQRYPLEEIARDIGVELLADSFKWLDADSRAVHTEGGKQLSYDALLLALGARMHARFKHVLTIDDKRLDDLLHGLIQDIEGGHVQSLAFIVPGRMGWPLPIYELALMTACRAYDVNVDLSITIATPEDAPLAVFGRDVSDAVAAVAGREPDRDDHFGPLRGSRAGTRSWSALARGASRPIVSSRCPSSTVHPCQVCRWVQRADSSRSMPLQGVRY